MHFGPKHVEMTIYYYEEEKKHCKSTIEHIERAATLNIIRNGNNMCDQEKTNWFKSHFDKSNHGHS